MTVELHRICQDYTQESLQYNYSFKLCLISSYRQAPAQLIILKPSNTLRNVHFPHRNLQS